MSTFVRLTRIDYDGKPHPIIVNIDQISTICMADSQYDPKGVAAYVSMLEDGPDGTPRAITADALYDLMDVLPLVRPTHGAASEVD